MRRVRMAPPLRAVATREVDGQSRMLSARLPRLNLLSLFSPRSLPSSKQQRLISVDQATPPSCGPDQRDAVFFGSGVGSLRCSALEWNGLGAVRRSGVLPRTSMRPPCLQNAAMSAVMFSLVNVRWVELRCDALRVIYLPSGCVGRPTIIFKINHLGKSPGSEAPLRWGDAHLRDSDGMDADAPTRPPFGSGSPVWHRSRATPFRRQWRTSARGRAIHRRGMIQPVRALVLEEEDVYEQ